MCVFNFRVYVCVWGGGGAECQNNTRPTSVFKKVDSVLELLVRGKDLKGRLYCK